jgi:hypothetical protein
VKTEKKEKLCLKSALKETIESLRGQISRLGTRREKGIGGW